MAAHPINVLSFCSGRLEGKFALRYMPPMHYICPMCSDKFQSKNKGRKFCSRTCRTEASRGTKRMRQVQHHCWKGGKFIDAEGYVRISSKGHCFAKKQRYIMEHRAVMEQHLQRELRPGEVVHHRNHLKADNRIENLEVLKASAHSSLHRRGEHDAMLAGKAVSTSLFKAKPATPCKLCAKPARNHGLCKTHATRLRTHGDAMIVIVRGKKLRQAENVWTLKNRKAEQ